MRKMMFLAAMVAIAALMMAASPASAQTNFDAENLRFVGDNNFCDIFDCDDEDDFCDIFDCNDDDGFCDDFDCNDEDNFCDIFDCRDHDNNNVVPAITQDLEQEADSGDVDQSFDVSQTGDNSNQTVGLQGVANTGNAQTQIGVIDAGPFVGDFNDNNDDFDRVFVADDFCDDFDSDGDGICDRLDRLEDRFEDLCEDDNDDGFCDRLENRIENLQDRIDDDVFFVVDNDDNDDGFVGNNVSDFEFDDVGSTIELSPVNTVSSDQQVNQAAAAFGK